MVAGISAQMPRAMPHDFHEGNLRGAFKFMMLLAAAFATLDDFRLCGALMVAERRQQSA